MGILILIVGISILSVFIAGIIALIKTVSHKKKGKYYFDKSVGAYGDKNNRKYLFSSDKHHDFLHVYFQYFICFYVPFVDIILGFLGSVW